MQATTNKNCPRKLWFIPRFSLRTFLVLCTLIGAVLGPFAYRTRQQIHLLGELEQQSIDFEVSDPPAWLKFLPESWLKIAGGQWCRTVESVELYGTQSYDDVPTEESLALGRNIKLLSKLPHLKRLEIRTVDSWSSPEELHALLSPLANIAGLQEIVIGDGDNENIDTVLAALPNMPNLRTLEIRVADDALTNKGLEEVHKFPQLEVLEFTGGWVTDDCLQTLSSLRHIKKIHVWHSRFSSAAMQCFANHPTLESFSSLTPCTDELLETIGTCPNMREIDASKSMITDDGLASLRDLKRLAVLNLSDTSITDAGLAHLVACKQLRHLSCAGCKLTDAAASTLSQFTKLEHLDLSRTLVTQKLLPQLSTMKELQSFDNPNLIIDANQVTEFYLDHPHLQKSYRGLDWKTVFVRLSGHGVLEPSHEGVLDLPNVRGLTGRIGQMRDLRLVSAVDLHGSDINDDDLRALAETCNLTSVNIQGTSITPAGLSVLAGETTLSELNVGPFDDADEAMKIISSFSMLTRLGFNGANTLNQTGRDYLLNLHKLESLSIDDCPFDEVLARKLSATSNLYSAYWLDRICSREVIGNRLRAPWETERIPRGLDLDPFDVFGLYEVKIENESELNALGRRSVIGLDVSGVPLSRAGIAAILRLSDIQSLNLSRTGLTDELLKPLSVLAKLKRLDCSDNPLTPNAAKTLINFASLSELNLAGTQITDKAIGDFAPSLNLDYIDLSRTSVSAKPWVFSRFPTYIVAKTLAIKEMQHASSILKELAWLEVNVMPAEVRTRGVFGISNEALMVLSKRKLSQKLSEMDVTPEILQTWPIEELLDGKAFLSCINIVETGDVGKILVTAARQCPHLRQIVFVGERLDASSLAQMPPSVREIYFKDCSLTPDAIDALRQCKWLTTLYFDSCKLDGCSLAPCNQMPFLISMTIKSTSISSEQRKTLDSLRPALAESVGW